MATSDDREERAKKAHEEWVTARAALNAAELAGDPPLLSEARWKLVDREREAYEALTDAVAAQLKEG